MYLSYYQLIHKPFQITSDPRFVWMGAKHRAALDFLQKKTAADTRLILLTGDVGTGKTTLVNCFINQLPLNSRTAVLTDPTIEIEAFHAFILRAFGIEDPAAGSLEAWQALGLFIQENNRQGNDVNLIIDEAHRLAPELLDAVRFLSQVETAGAGRFYLFLVGQDELDHLRDDPRQSWLKGERTAFFRLEPLNEAETGTYVRHRLQIAGKTAPVFTAEALAAVYQFTGGFPRLINILCDHALIEGYVSEQKLLGAQIIRKCAAQMPLVMRKTGPNDETLPGIPPPSPNLHERSASVWEHTGSPEAGASPPGTGGKVVSYFVIACLFILLGSYLFSLRLVDSASHKLTPPLAALREEQGSPPENPPPGIPPAAPDPVTVGGGTPGDTPASVKKTAGESPPVQAEPDPEPPPSRAGPTRPSEPASPGRSPAGSANAQAVSPDTQTGALSARALDEDAAPDKMAVLDSPAAPPAADLPARPHAADARADSSSVRGNGGIDAGPASFLAGETPTDSQPESPAELPPLTETRFSIHFPVSSHRLPSEALPLLDRIAAHLLQNPPENILIIGYTDSSGSYRGNIRLAEKRADAVKAFLRTRGISVSLLDSYGAGPVNPVASNRTSAGRRANRRVEIELEYKNLDIGAPF